MRALQAKDYNRAEASIFDKGGGSSKVAASKVAAPMAHPKEGADATNSAGVGALRRSNRMRDAALAAETEAAPTADAHAKTTRDKDQGSWLYFLFVF